MTWLELCERLARADAAERLQLVPHFLRFARAW